MKFVGFVSTGMVAGRREWEFEVPDEDLEACSTEEGRTKLIDEYFESELPNYADWGWKKVE